MKRTSLWEMKERARGTKRAMVASWWRIMGDMVGAGGAWEEGVLVMA